MFAYVRRWSLVLTTQRYHQIMKDRGVDFILCPAYIGAAATLGSGQYFHYTSIWNILDQPCVTFPTGLKVDPKLDIVDEQYKPRSKADKREYDKCKLSQLNFFTLNGLS